jgi:predicted esterase
MLRRRRLLGVAAGLAVAPWVGRAAAGESLHYELRDIQVAGSRRVGRRFTLLVPKKHKGRAPPLLVLLHGLGETHDERMGAYAWVERYGLGSCYDRLREPPVKRLDTKVRHWTDARLAQVNAMLEDRRFAGMAIACPYTPNVYQAPNRKALLDEYADWIVDEVVPRARKESGADARSASTYLDGCSLGGYVGAEVYVRKVKHFGAWGTLQGALGDHRIAGYADAIAQANEAHGARHIHIETSTGDAFRKTNEAFSRLLTKKGVAHDFLMPPGPHNQPFLRDSGTLEMLLWYDRLPRR